MPVSTSRGGCKTTHTLCKNWPCSCTVQASGAGAAQPVGSGRVSRVSVVCKQSCRRVLGFLTGCKVQAVHSGMKEKMWSLLSAKDVP